MPGSSLKTFLTVAVLLAPLLSGAARAQDLTPEEVRSIAKEAYIYGFPLVDSYRIQHAYFVNTGSPEYKGLWNQLASLARLATPEDKAVQTPNSDTPYSFVGMDLRIEPMVLTVPPMEDSRYFSIQLIDAYTFNFDYIGSRTTGNDGGSYMVTGPGWRGDVPEGISKVIQSETEFVFAIYRTQVFSADDLDNVIAIQGQYRAEPLSTFLGEPAPAAAPAIEFPPPLTPETQKTDLEFFNLLNFVLQFAPTHPSETELMERFAKIGIGAGLTFDPIALSPEIMAAIEAGRADALAEYTDFAATKISTGEVTAGQLFGTREFLQNNYLYRMAGAVLGIYGNSKDEAMYPVYSVDSDGQTLDGSNCYTLRFAPGELPPAHGFWSLTMYEMPASLLYANPLNRYLLNSPMLPELKTDEDGGLTLYIQNESPGADLASNWLPAPSGPFVMYMRIYWPKPDALDGTWVQPELVKAE